MPTVEEIRKAMEANSAAWKTADAETQKKLYNENQNLGVAIGAKYDPSGTWDFSAAKSFENPSVGNTGGTFGALRAAANPGVVGTANVPVNVGPPKTAMSATTYYAPQQAAAPTGYQSSYKGPDIAGMRDRLNQSLNLKQAAGLTGIRNARDTALQGYNKAETQAKNQAYNQKNQVAGNSALAAKRLSEILASQGITGGDNLSANSRLQASAQGNLSQIGQQESALLQDILERRNLTSNQAVSQENALVQESEADRINRLLQLDQYGDERALQLDQVNYGRYRDTVDDTFRNDQAALQQALQEAGLLGTYNGQQTLQSAAQQFNQQQASKQYDYQVGRDQVSDQRWNTQFDYQKARDSIADERYKAEFDFNAKKYGNDYALQKAQLDGQLANQANDNELQRLRLAAEQASSGLDAEYKQAQIDSLKNKANQTDTTTAETYSKYVDGVARYSKTSDGSDVLSNPNDVESSILMSGLPESEMRKLYIRYGLKWGG